MTNPICGHGRDVLIWALRLAEAMPRTAQTSFRPPDPTPEELARMHAVDDVHDPGKLAAMMAEEGRRLGFAERGAEIVDIDAPIPMPTRTLAEHGRVVICVLVPQKPRWKRYMLTTPQARAILLQWLKLPDGTREGAERALKGES